MWGKIVENPNIHVMCPLLIYSKISNWMVKVIKLPCTFSMVLRIQYKKMFIFKKRMYCEVRSKIPNLLNRLLHETVFLYPIMILTIFFCILNIYYYQEYEKCWGKLEEVEYRLHPTKTTAYCINTVECS